jgi:adenylate cyclase
MPFISDDPTAGLALRFAMQGVLITSLVFMLMVQTVVGGRVLKNLILGRYHEPLAEARIFMFIDVSGSTALAEKFGGVGAYSTISRFFFDVAQETARYGGEVELFAVERGRGA